jgi:hypothetical protein
MQSKTLAAIALSFAAMLDLDGNASAQGAGVEPE